MIRVSVAMVTYNGDQYLQGQIDSILENMQSDDELVISDDGSTDRTLDIVKQNIQRDARIKLVYGPGKGVKLNIDCVLRHCQGNYIFLSDQDDIWASDKVEKVMKVFMESGCRLVIHDAAVVKMDGKTVIMDSFFSHKNARAGVVKNIWKNSYIGCCMAFKSTLLTSILPIPNNIEMHDQWIGVINDIQKGGTNFLEESLLSYRRHGDNASKLHHHGVGKMIRNRIVFIVELMCYHRQICRGKNY